MLSLGRLRLATLSGVDYHVMPSLVTLSLVTLSGVEGKKAKQKRKDKAGLEDKKAKHFLFYYTLRLRSV